MFPDVIKACDEYTAKQIKNYPCHTNRASAIGDHCTRRLVYERTRWQDKQKHSVDTEYIFDIGNLLERPVVALLENAGFDIIRNQEPLKYMSKKKILWTGHIDGVLIDKVTGLGEFVLEVKTMNPHVWETINTPEDFQRYFWTKKYSAQLTCYMFDLEIPRGIWILKNKSSGKMKQINYELDFEFFETILQKCESINQHIENETLPDYLKDEPDHCELKCAYFHICNPPLDREPAKLIIDPLLINTVKELHELEPHVTRYKYLRKEVEKKLAGTVKAFIGNYMFDNTARQWAKKWTKL